MERIWRGKPEAEGGGVLPWHHFRRGRERGHAGGGGTQAAAVWRARV